MHYFRWPLGSTGTVTIWVREAELADALAFLAAPVEESWPADETCGSGLWTVASRNPRVFYGVWLAMIASGFFAL
jgi:hypothetical protein